jgi:hypothetical protein
VIALPWHSPRPFSAAARVEAEGGTFILKRHHQTLRSVDGLTQEHRFMAHLRKGGVSVPEVMAQAAGDVGALGLGEWTYELHRASPGADLYRDRHSWTGFLSMDHARAAGHALARLHLAAEGYGASPRRADPLIASFTIVPAADWRGAAQAYIAARPALEHYLRARDWQGELAGIFAQFGHGLCDRVAGQAALWTHNDWHPPTCSGLRRERLRRSLTLALRRKPALCTIWPRRLSVALFHGLTWAMMRQWRGCRDGACLGSSLL